MSRHIHQAVNSLIQETSKPFHALMRLQNFKQPMTLQMQRLDITGFPILFAMMQLSRGGVR